MSVRKRPEVDQRPTHPWVEDVGRSEKKPLLELPFTNSPDCVYFERSEESTFCCGFQIGVDRFRFWYGENR